MCYVDVLILASYSAFLPDCVSSSILHCLATQSTLPTCGETTRFLPKASRGPEITFKTLVQSSRNAIDHSDELRVSRYLLLRVLSCINDKYYYLGKWGLLAIKTRIETLKRCHER